MKLTPIWIGLSILLVFALGTCSINGFTPPGEISAEPTDQPDDGQEEDREGAEPPGPPATGVSVAVPAISPLLLSALNATYQPESSGLSAQALLFATRVEMQLYDESMNLADEWTVSNEEGLTDVTGETGPMIQDFREVEPGSYTIEAQVYNGRVSSEVPVVTGVSEQFVVSAGVSTQVVIIADPYQPVVLDTDDQTEPLSLYQSPYAFVEPPAEEEWEGEITFTDLGGEAWFELGVEAVTDLYGRIVADPGGNADAALLQFEGGSMPDEGLDPGLSYGFSPDGEGGTRAAMMGPLDGAAQYYFAAVLMNRDGNSAQEAGEVRFDTFVRPYVDYTNAVELFVEPTPPGDFDLLAAGTEVTQTLFYIGDGPDEAVHYYQFDIPWGHEDLEDTFTATVTITLDVLQMEHLMGFVQNDQGDPGMMLAVILDDGVGTTEFITSNSDPDRGISENDDGSTTLSFDVEIDTVTYAFVGLGISSTWEANQYTLSWTAPGMLGVSIY